MPLNFNPYVNQDPNAGQWVDKIVNTFFGIQQLNDARKQWQAEFEFKKDIATEELEMKKEEFGMQKKLFERQFADLDKQIEMIDKTMAWLDIDIAAADKRGRIDNNVVDSTDVGLFQINSKAWPGLHDKYNLFNPSENLAAAREVYNTQGLGAWSAYNNKTYEKYLGQKTSYHDEILKAFPDNAEVMEAIMMAESGGNPKALGYNYGSVDDTGNSDDVQPVKQKSIDEIVKVFAEIQDWSDQYKYLDDLQKTNPDAIDFPLAYTKIAAQRNKESNIYRDYYNEKYDQYPNSVLEIAPGAFYNLYLKNFVEGTGKQIWEDFTGGKQ